MKITFITGCLQPGRSGVGDYVRDLAAECMREGHKCQVIGLNDDFVDRELEDSQTSAVNVAQTNSSSLCSLRLPSRWSWKQRTAIACDAIGKFGADVVSIQFVCYGYQRKGLVWGLANRLRKLCRGKKVHVMFHELWIGEAKEASFKHRLVGCMQKRLVLDLVHKVKPHAVQTNCSAYVGILGKNGVQAKRLPLFGSIPISGNNADEWLLPLLSQVGVPISQKCRTSFWLFGFFGSLHPEWDAEPLFSYIREAAHMCQKQCVFVSIGNKGQAGDLLWRDLVYRYGKQVHFLELGQQPAEKISEVLLSVDFGVSSTPVGLIGKSSSTAAMLEHGLPIIVSRNDFDAGCAMESDEMERSMVRVTPDLPGKLPLLEKIPAKSRLNAVTRQFLLAMHA